MTKKPDDAAILELNNKLTTGKIKRRDFLAGSVALGMSFPAASLLADQARAATPKRGGRFRVASGQGSTTDSLDPSTFDNQYAIMIGYGFRNNLTELSSTDELTPELAESWEATSDAATWTFNLRKGVEFHNGKTFDSGDVLATFDHHLKEDSKSVVKGLLTAVEEIKADGKNRVIFKLKAGNADFPVLLTDYHLTIMPSDGEGNAEWASGNGTGGYAITRYEAGVQTDMKRFANYWKEGTAHFDEVEALSIIDVVARTNALTSGALDAIDRCDRKTVHLLKRDTDIVVEDVTSAAHCAIAMNTTVAPFDNNDVRLALKYAIDREALLKKILYGFGTVGNDHPIAPTLKYHANELPQRQYDPDKAKFHLKKAGLSELKVTLHTAETAFAGATDAAVLYQSSAAKAGIELDVARDPNDGYWNDIWLKEPFVVSNWGARPTQDMMFSTVYAAEAPWNETFWKHSRFNDLLVAARAELDQAKRHDMYVEMQTICSNEGGAIVPFFNNYVYARHKNVEHGPGLGSTWDLDGNKAMERWWFA